MAQCLAKIVCTMGPSVSSRETIVKLIQNGMRVARLNASHSTPDFMRDMVGRIRRVSGSLKIPVAILLDLQGPKIRLGDIPAGPVMLKTGATFTLVKRAIPGDAARASTTYPKLTGELSKGDRVFLNDGLVQLRVEKMLSDAVECRVIAGGEIGSRKGINLPDTPLSMPTLTAKDRRDLKLGIELGVDYCALSFVRRPEDVRMLKRLVQRQHADIPIIAKLEKPEAIEHLEAIIRESDGVMIARGDLGVEMPLEKIPPLQKRIIHLARRMTRPVITATQMLESMRTSPVPTRAEVSDVANAVFDWTDAVMLSAETASGQYPVKTVQIMSGIVVEAEAAMLDTSFHRPLMGSYNSIPHTIGRLVNLTVAELSSSAIVAFTQSGYSARIISSYRPMAPIYAFTPSESVRRRLALYHGVTSFHLGIEEHLHTLTDKAEQILLKARLCRKGDLLVVVAGAPIHQRGNINLINLHRVGGPRT